MRKIGIALIVLGIIGFFIGDLSFTTTEQVVDVGPLEVEQEKEQTIPTAPAISGVVCAIGVVLLILDWRQ
jgi:nitrate reductase gamma subunit